MNNADEDDKEKNNIRVLHTYVHLRKTHSYLLFRLEIRRQESMVRRKYKILRHSSTIPVNGLYYYKVYFLCNFCLKDTMA